MVLAVGAALAGFLNVTADGALSRFLEPVLGPVPEGTAGLARPVLIVLSMVFALLALVVAWFVYASGSIDWLALRVRLAPLQRLFANGWYVDDYYSAILVTPGEAAAAFSAYVFDARVIDGAVNGIGTSVRRLAAVGRRLQTGLVRTYALALLAGALGVLVYVGFRL
jgi:NADH-quinone oxidoreductase subunit L